MNKMINFNEYLVTKIFEAMELKIKEVELVLNPRLIKILKEMNHQIASDLLDTHVNGKREFKSTFVDLGSEAGNVSMIQGNKVPELIEPELTHGDYHRETEVIPAVPSKRKLPYKEKDQKNWIGGYFDYVQQYKNPWISDSGHMIDLHDDQFKSKDHPVWTKNRAEIKIGRFVSTLFPNRYPANMKREELDKMEKPIDVESFVNMFIATVEAHSKILKLVDGKDIVHYYSSDHYAKAGGTLGGSCMNSPSKQEFIKFYQKNPEKVQMLVLYPEDVRDKIIGRALIWTLDEPVGRQFMDRIYTANDSDSYLFTEYAKAHGFFYKSTQTFGWDYDIIDGKTGQRGTVEMKTKLKRLKHKTFPYLDTMQFYKPTTGEITNDGRRINADRKSSKGYYFLADAGGGYQDLGE